MGGKPRTLVDTLYIAAGDLAIGYIDFKWGKLTKAEWETYFNQVAPSNHFQSWAYGEASGKETPFHPKRGLILRKNKPIGLVQIMQRSIFGGKIQHTKLLRGPLWFVKTSLVDQLITLDQLRKLFKKSLLKNYNFLGEMPLSREAGNFFRNKSCMKVAPPYSTILVSLAPQNAILRKNLRPKWRNQLVQAEREEIEVTKTTTLTDQHRLIQAFTRLKRTKFFTGPSEKFLKTYLESTPYLHLVARDAAKNILAEVLFTIHGSTATYLIGMISKQGRTMQAKNLLMWQALIRLKENGILYVDLGGIHMKRSDKITHFKEGLGGQFFETLPTYV